MEFYRRDFLFTFLFVLVKEEITKENTIKTNENEEFIIKSLFINK